MRAQTIGRAAREAGVNVETVRFYERRGLVERPLKGDGYRTYSPELVARIRFIKEAQQIGFSLSEIRELMALRADPSAAPHRPFPLPFRRSGLTSSRQ